MKTSDKLLHFFLVWPNQNLVKKRTKWPIPLYCDIKLSHFRKLPDLYIMIKVNSFYDFDKSVHSLIRLTVHLA